MIAGYTVLHGRGQTPKGIALVDVAGDRRAMVTTDDGTLVAQMQRDELVGRTVMVDQNVLTEVDVSS